MKVVWTFTARNNLRTIHHYIAQSSPAYAKRMADRLISRTEQIAAFPLSGRVVPEFKVDHIRELLERPYRIIYHIRPSRIEVGYHPHVAKNVDNIRIV